MTRVAPSLEHVPYSRIREIAELAMSLDGVLALYFGESDVPTPRFVIDAAEQALEDGHTFYSPNAGIASLRRAIASQYQRLHGAELDPTSGPSDWQDRVASGHHTILRAASDLRHEPGA